MNTTIMSMDGMTFAQVPTADVSKDVYTQFIGLIDLEFDPQLDMNHSHQSPYDTEV